MSLPASDASARAVAYRMTYISPISFTVLSALSRAGLSPPMSFNRLYPALMRASTVKMRSLAPRSMLHSWLGISDHLSVSLLVTLRSSNQTVLEGAVALYSNLLEMYAGSSACFAQTISKTGHWSAVVADRMLGVSPYGEPFLGTQFVCGVVHPVIYLLSGLGFRPRRFAKGDLPMSAQSLVAYCPLPLSQMFILPCDTPCIWAIS